MPTSLRCGGSRIISRSAKRMLPASGRLKPAIAISNVVLPEPEGPSRVRNSPLSMFRSTASRAYKSPYFLVRPLMVIGSALLDDWSVDMELQVPFSVFYKQKKAPAGTAGRERLLSEALHATTRSSAPYKARVLPLDASHTSRVVQAASWAHLTGVTAKIQSAPSVQW